MPQQYQHPQPSATPTGQAQQGGQHGGNHPAPSPVQQHQAAAAQALHMGNQPQQQMYQALAPTPPSMTPGTNPQSPQGSFPSAQQAVYLHPQQMQHGYNPSHMAHMQQVSSTFRSPSLHSEYILYEQVSGPRNKIIHHFYGIKVSNSCMHLFLLIFFLCLVLSLFRPISSLGWCHPTMVTLVTLR